MALRILALVTVVGLGCATDSTSTPDPTDVPPSTAAAVPTQTPIPTPTVDPTPTRTPVPTDTPTPLPTYTPAPTYTPQPTYTPLPTYTPVPTPTATLAHTPSPNLVPTSIPTPFVLNYWTPSDRRIDSLTDEVSVAFVSVAREHNLGGDAKKPLLAVRCRSKGETEVFVNWGQYMGGTDDHFDSRLRWDDGTPVKARWNESTTNESTFMQSGWKFVEQALLSEILFMRLWDYRGRHYDAEFDVAGLSGRMDVHKDICRE